METRVFHTNLDRFKRAVEREGKNRIVSEVRDGDDVIVTLEQRTQPRRETRSEFRRSGW